MVTCGHAVLLVLAPVYQFLTERIGERLGRPVELVVGRSFDQFEQGTADLG